MFEKYRGVKFASGTERREIIDELGWFGYLIWALNERWKRYVFLSKEVSVFALAVDGYPFRYERRRSYCEVTRLTPESLDDHAGDSNLRPILHDVRTWVERGDECWIATRDGRVHALIDLQRFTYRDDEGLKIAIADDECKVLEILLFEEFRRTPSLGVLHDAVIRRVAELGIRTVYGAVAVGCRHESASTRGGQKALRAAAHFGYREIRRSRCHRLFGRFTGARDLWRAASLDDARKLSW